MESHWWEQGRQQFPLIADGPRDYAGQDFNAVYLANSDALSHAFLNGVSVVGCAFDNIQLDYCELAESTFSDTKFVNVNLSASDFVRSAITDCTFEACNFSNGEWRQSKFEDVNFVGCDFTHTTINLSSFQNCRFSNELSGSLDRRSISYNTFAVCSFEKPVSDHLVISRNFGLPSLPGISPPTPAHAGMTLEELCVQSSTGLVTARNLIDALHDEGAKPQGRLKKLRLEFISNIIGLLARKGMLSASSLTYVETILVEFAKRATNEVDFMAVMTAVVNVRNALYDVATKAANTGSLQDVTCAGIVFRFKAMFNHDEAQTFIDTLSEVVFGRGGDIEIVSVRAGSTWIECVFPILASASTVMGAVNLLLSQSNTTVDKVTQLSGKLIRALRRKRPTAPQRPTKRPTKRRKPKESSRMPAIMNPAIAVPELVTIRAAMQRSGEILVRFDDQVEIRLIISDQRRELRR
jgi:hypothetical protein